MEEEKEKDKGVVESLIEGLQNLYISLALKEKEEQITESLSTRDLPSSQHQIPTTSNKSQNSIPTTQEGEIKFFTDTETPNKTSNSIYISQPQVIISPEIFETSILNIREQNSIIGKDLEESKSKGFDELKPSNKYKLKTYQSLKDLFLAKQQENKSLRHNINKKVVFFRLPRVMIMKRIFCYLDLNEIINLTEVSEFFNSMIKSTIFLKYFVELHSKTQVAIRIGTFQTAKILGLPMTSELTGLGAGGMRRPREDTDEEIRALKTVKTFMTKSIKEHQVHVKTLQNDLEILKNLIRIEKQINKKSNILIGKMRREFEDFKVSALGKEDEQTILIHKLTKEVPIYIYILGRRKERNNK